MGVWWVNGKMKRIWKDQAVSIGNYIFFWKDSVNSQKFVT